MQDPTLVGEDFPRSLRDPDERDRRRELLYLPHVKPLKDFVETLRRRASVEVPDFDPLDGGIEARSLFLFEKPGPMTAETGSTRRAGSGFISRNNDDPTAEATFNFMVQAMIPRKCTILWNVIPWWNGTRKVTKDELRDGLGSSVELTTLLPKLRAVVLVGKNAERARGHFEKSGLDLFVSAHPSPLVKARWPDRWNSIPDQWAKVRTKLVGTEP